MMAVGNQNQSGFNNASELFANVLKLLGPNAEIIGPNFIINAKGAFVYDINISGGASGAGHLVASALVPPLTGPPPIFDNFNNSILPGFTVYNNTGGSGSLNSLMQCANLTVNEVTFRTAPQYNQTYNNTYSFFTFGSTNIPALALNVQTVTFPAIGTGLITDAQARFQFDGNGKMQWGSGAANPDTDLFRQGPGNLQTDGSITANAALNAFGGVGVFKNNDTAIAFSIATLFDANNRFQIDDQGKLSWGAGGNSAVDTDLFRQAASTLATDSILSLKNAVSAPPAITGYTEIVGSGANLPFATGASGQGWFLSGAAQNDYTQTTAVSIAQTPIGKQWTIDLNDANVGDSYEFDLQFIGKQGSTVQSLTISWILSGTNIGGITFPTTFAGVSAVFLGRVKLCIDIVTNGAGGTAYWHLQGLTSAAGGLQQPEGGGPTTTTAIAYNTTVNNTVQFAANWSAITGAPTMTSIVTKARKLS